MFDLWTTTYFYHLASGYNIARNMDHLYRHCQVMGSLLVGQSLSTMEHISGIGSQGCCNISPTPVSSSYSHVRTLKWISMEENGSGGLIQRKKKQREDYADDDCLCGIFAESGRNQCNELQNQVNMFDLQPSDSMINFQEFNGWALKQTLKSLP